MVQGDLPLGLRYQRYQPLTASSDDNRVSTWSRSMALPGLQTTKVTVVLHKYISRYQRQYTRMINAQCFDYASVRSS